MILIPHIHEKVDFTVEVFIVYKSTVLLRKHDKYKIWLSVGGHIEPDEDPNQAAMREVKEEVGMDIKLFGKAQTSIENGDGYRELIPPRFLNRHRISPTHEHVTLTFFATAKSDKFKPDTKELGEEIRWFSIDDLTSKNFELKEHIREYAKTALAEVANKTN